MSIIIFARCEECHQHTELFHLDWYQIMCPTCGAEIENNYVVEEGHQISGAPSAEGEAW